MMRGILAELAEQFAHSLQWARRQSFAFLCSSLIRTPGLPDDIYARDVLPHLLDLSWDNVVNVRIAVARTLACDVITYRECYIRRLKFIIKPEPHIRRFSENR